MDEDVGLPSLHHLGASSCVVPEGEGEGGEGVRAADVSCARSAECGVWAARVCNAMCRAWWRVLWTVGPGVGEPSH